MTRIEEATNKIIEFIDIVKDAPKNESILAIGLDMVEWADKTMLDRVYDFIISNIYKYGKVKFVDNKATFDFRMNTFLNDLKQAMEE